MKAAGFDYVVAHDQHEAVDLLAADGTLALAGGQSLVPLMVRRVSRPARVCDLNRLAELGRIEVDDAQVTIGSMVRQRDLETHPGANRAQPLIGLAISTIGFVGTRHRGTIGGSLCHADPCAELPALAVLLDARVTLRRSSGVRDVPAEEFFTDGFATERAADELLTQVHFPVHPGRRVGAVKLRPGQDRPLGCLVSYRSGGEQRIEDARVAVFGEGGPARRLRVAEQMLDGELPGSDVFTAAARTGAESLRDLPGALSPQNYRRRLGRAAIGRALTMAKETGDE